MPHIPSDTAQDFAERLFVANGVSSDDASVVAKHLVESNLAGHDSHGVMRIPQYLGAIETKQLEINSQPKVLSQFASGATIDGQRCFGQVACVTGMSLAVQLAKETGIAAVTMKNSYHTGRIGAYAEQAAESGMFGIVMCNAGGGGQSVAPFGGRRRRLATNPISMAAPHQQGFPVLLDMATSVAPEGKVRLRKLQGDEVPAGWIMDAEGKPSTDPNDFYADPPGAIFPLGGEVGHKGFGLAVMIEILAGALSGGGVCTEDEVLPQDNVLMIAIDVDRYSGLGPFQHHVTELVQYIQSTPAAPGFDQVLAPGEMEFQARQKRATVGIELDDETWQELSRLADRAGVDFLTA